MSSIVAILAVVVTFAAAATPNKFDIFVPALISAIASVTAAWIGSRNMRNLGRTETKVDTATVKLDDNAQKVQVMHELVNGAATAANEALAVQSRALAVMTTRLADMTEKRDKLVEDREKAHTINRDNPLDVNIVNLDSDNED